MSCLGVMNLKSPNRITVTASNAKGEIGFVSNTNVQQKLTKVKATVANIPVGTESMQKLSGKHAYPPAHAHTHTRQSLCRNTQVSTHTNTNVHTHTQTSYRVHAETLRWALIPAHTHTHTHAHTSYRVHAETLRWAHICAHTHTHIRIHA